MAGLLNKTIAESYKSLLRMESDTVGISTGLARVTDGEGTVGGLLIAGNGARVQPVDDDNTEIFTVRDKDDNYLLRVDSDNDVVKANVGQEIINTNYAYFNVTNIDSAEYAANTHQAIPFGGAGHGDLAYPPEFGTGTDPATTFTTSSGNGAKASDLTPCLWYVPDNITIDGVMALVGADASGGETLNLHLFKYRLNSGSTSALDSGTLLAYSHSNTNDGNEQPYKYTWTVETDNKNVSAGLVILAFLECTSTVASDYSVQITVKYHLT